MDMNHFIDLIEQKKKLYEISQPVDFQFIKVGDHIVYKSYASDHAYSGRVIEIRATLPHSYLFVDTAEGFIYNAHHTFRLIDEDWDLGI